MAYKLATQYITMPDGRKLPVITRDSDLGRAVAQEVMSGIAYPIPPFIKDVRTVVDIGGNIGLASIWFSYHYPESRIVTAEPSPEAFAVLTENARTWTRIEPHQLGLHARRAERVPLYAGFEDDVTGSIGRSPHNINESTPITIEDAEIFLRDRNVDAIDVLKLDTEGCEIPILERLAPRLPAIRVIYMEYHSDSDRRRIDEMLSPTHIMYAGRVMAPHRGEFCYIGREAFPSAAERDANAIRMPDSF